MTNEALLIIDYTNDFVDDKGALTCGKPAQELDDAITNLADEVLKEGKWVIFPTDKHFKDDPYHPETKLFPHIICLIPGVVNYTVRQVSGTKITKIMIT